MYDLNPTQTPIINEVPTGGGQISHFLKGLESRHTAYYFDDIPIPHVLNGCEVHLEKLPTMITKGSGLGGAMVHTLAKQPFKNVIGVSTNGGIEQRTNFHAEENNHFLTGALAGDTDGGWHLTPSRYPQSGVKDRVTSIEGLFQTGHQDAEQKLTISSVNQYVQNTYDDLNDQQEYQRHFNLFGVSYERQNWRTFAALHTSRTQTTNNVVLTAGVHKNAADHHLGFFTQQINNHKVYRYDIYGSKRIGVFFPSVRVIKTERQVLCPFEISIAVAKPIKIICGSVYHLPDEFQRFDPQYGNFDLRPEHNYHCHIVHNCERSNWTMNQTLFINHVTNMIEFSFNQPYKNRGTLNTVGLDQSIAYDGFDRYKIGFAHTYGVLDGSEPILRRPAWKFLIWQRFCLSENCFVDLRAHFTGSYLDGERTNFDKHTKMPSVLSFDVGTTHILNKNWTILCEVQNLTDHHYEKPRGYRAKGIEAWIRLVYTI